MTDHDAPDLAAQAAAWVPPWQRPTQTETGQPVRPGAPPGDGVPAGAAPSSGELADVDTDDIAAVADLPTAEWPAVTPRAPVPSQPDAGDAADSAPGGSARPAVPAVPAQPTADRPVTPEPVRLRAPRPVRDDDEPTLVNLPAALEAILLVVDEPVTEAQLAEVLDSRVEEIGSLLGALAAEYAEQGRGFDLRRAAGGWRLYTRPEYASYVERFVLDGQSVRLTQAALETLAVIAYQQPVTRARISAIRGVNCDGVVRTLTTRGLIEECGAQPESGAYLYRTTSLFLEKLGLDSVDELPPLAPFLPDDVEGLTDAPR